jgi:hypothetical protein
LELQISTFVTVKLIGGCSPLSLILEGSVDRASEFGATTKS